MEKVPIRVLDKADALYLAAFNSIEIINKIIMDVN